MQHASPARRFALVTLAVSAGALLAVSCGGDDDGDPPMEPGPSVASVSVTPQEATIAAGQTAEFSASAEDSDGNSVDDAEFSWSSTSSSVATVDDQGVATGESDGTTEIVAEAEGVADSASLTVSSASASSIAQVSGDGQSGVTTRDYDEPLVVEASDENGDPVEGAPIDWAVASGDASLSSQTTVTDSEGRASVGVEAGTSTGSITVEASHEGADGSPVSFGLETSTVLFLMGDNYFEDPEGRQNTDAAAEISLGHDVLWEWIGNNQHNVLSGEGQGGSSGDGVPDGGSAVNSGDPQSDGTYSFTPQVEGTWTFYCEVHPNQMYGSTFTVSGSSSSDVSGGLGHADLEPGDEIRPEGSPFVFVYQGVEGEDR